MSTLGFGRLVVIEPMSEDLECPVCLEEYDLAECQPRMLLCAGSHEICSGCVAKLDVQSTWSCPQCREWVPARSNPNRSLIAALQLNLHVRDQTAPSAPAVADETLAAPSQRTTARRRRRGPRPRDVGGEGRPQGPETFFPWRWLQLLRALVMVSLAASVVFWLDRRLSSYAPASFDDCLLEVVGPTGRAFSVRELPDRIAPGQFKEIFDLAHVERTQAYPDAYLPSRVPSGFGVAFNGLVLPGKSMAGLNTFTVSLGEHSELPAGFWSNSEFNDPSELLADYISIKLISKLDGRVVHVKREGLQDAFDGWGGRADLEGRAAFTDLQKNIVTYPRRLSMDILLLHKEATMMVALGGDSSLAEQEQRLSSLPWVPP